MPSTLQRLPSKKLLKLSGGKLAASCCCNGFNPCAELNFIPANHSLEVTFGGAYTSCNTCSALPGTYLLTWNPQFEFVGGASQYHGAYVYPVGLRMSGQDLVGQAKIGNCTENIFRATELGIAVEAFCSQSGGPASPTYKKLGFRGAIISGFQGSISSWLWAGIGSNCSNCVGLYRGTGDSIYATSQTITPRGIAASGRLHSAIPNSFNDCICRIPGGLNTVGVSVRLL